MTKRIGEGGAAKQERKEAILGLVGSRRLGSQEAIRAVLSDRGIDVTQATLSRDMAELKLVKVMGADGGPHYALPGGEGQAPPVETLLSSLFLSAEAAGNLMVVRTMTGGAQAVALAIDSEEWAEVLGTLAGDDTVLVILREAEQAVAVAARLRAIAGAKAPGPTA